MRCSRFFLIFSLNYKQGVTQCCYSYRQMRRVYKIKFTDKSKANLWTYLDLAKVHCLKGLTSPYIISYLHLLNLIKILTLPQTLVFAEAGFGLTQMMFALFFCLPDLHACMLVYKIKTCKLSMYIYNRCLTDIELITHVAAFIKP